MFTHRLFYLSIPGPRPLDCVGAAWAWDHCVSVCNIMRVYVPHFRSIYLTISTLVAGQETNGIVKAGSATDSFGGKYTDDVWVEKKK